MIKFDYEQALKQAKELRRISERIQKISKNLENGRAELACSWKGDAANLFMEKSERLYGKISKTAGNAGKIAGAIEISAKAIKTAEDSAKEIVQAVTGK